MWLILGSLFFPLIAQADASTAIETSLSFAFFNWVRNHPGTTLLLVLLVLGTAAGIALWVVRQVKSEARDYLQTGRTTWKKVSSRVTGKSTHLHAVPRPKETESQDRPQNSQRGN